MLGSISWIESEVRKDIICSMSQVLYASRAAMAFFRSCDIGLFMVLSSAIEPIVKVYKYVIGDFRLTVLVKLGLEVLLWSVR